MSPRSPQGVDPGCSVHSFRGDRELDVYRLDLMQPSGWLATLR